MGIIDRIGSMAGTQTGDALNVAHETFQQRMAEHGHTGKALVQTLVELCEKHPAAVGLGVGVMVDLFLSHERRQAEAHKKATQEAEAAERQMPPAKRARARRKRLNTKPPHHMAHIRPGKVFFDVFGGLVALKFATMIAHIMGRKSHKEAWFAPAAKIHLISASLAGYYAAKALKAKEVSAWRNAAVALFATDAIKPVLRMTRKARAEAEKRAALAAAAEPEPTQAALPAASETAHGHSGWVSVGHDAPADDGHGGHGAEDHAEADHGPGDEHSHGAAVH